jgi:hypothetical protein
LERKKERKNIYLGQHNKMEDNNKRIKINRNSGPKTESSSAFCWSYDQRWSSAGPVDEVTHWATAASTAAASYIDNTFLEKKIGRLKFTSNIKP